MSSYMVGKEWVSLYLKSHFPKGSTCLDVGCCDGFWSKILSDHFILDGVEAWGQNIKENHLHEIYREVFYDDIKDYHYVRNYDVIIFGDIIEHLSVVDAQYVLDMARPHAKEIIVAIPYKYPQGAKNNNPYEEHIQDDLTKEIFMERYSGYNLLYEWDNQYGYFMVENNGRTNLDYNKEYYYSKTRLDSIIYGCQPIYPKDYLYVMRYCFDIIYAKQHLGISNKDIYNELSPYFQILIAQIELNKIPSNRRFWRVIYLLTKDFTNKDSLYKLALYYWPHVFPTEEPGYLLLDYPWYMIDQIGDYFEASIAEYNIKNYSEAIDLTEKILMIEPNNEMAAYNLKLYKSILENNSNP